MKFWPWRLLINNWTSYSNQLLGVIHFTRIFCFVVFFAVNADGNYQLIKLADHETSKTERTDRKTDVEDFYSLLPLKLYIRTWILLSGASDSCLNLSSPLHFSLSISHSLRRARHNSKPETGYDIRKKWNFGKDPGELWPEVKVESPEKNRERWQIQTVCVCVCLYLVRSMLHISHLGRWEFSNRSWSVNSWLHRANDGCCLTVLYLQGLFQCKLCVWNSVLYPYASVFVETYIWIFLLLYCNRCVASAGTNQAAIWELHLLLFILSIWLEAVRTTWGEKRRFYFGSNGPW